MGIKFRDSFIKDMEKAGIETGAAEPPRYWFSTGNYALNRTISGSFLKGIPQGRLVCFAGPSGSGKAQPLSAKVLTPTGWKYMGDLTLEDVVITPSGETSKVIGIFPQGKKDIYTITFSDGASTQCCKEHLWKCWVRDETLGKLTEQIVSTEFIINFLNEKKKKGFRKNISINLVEPIQYKEAHLPIPPYLLGCLLGDGSITTSTPTITTSDEHIIKKIQECLTDDYYVQKHNNGYNYSIRQTDNEYRSNEKQPNKYTVSLKALGIWGKRSHEKFIPDVYKYSSIDQRIELIRGLFDTDGTVGKQGDISFTTTSYVLAKDIQEIMWSLGAKCSVKTRKSSYRSADGKVNGKDFYHVSVSYKNPKDLFSLPRKQSRCSTSFQKKQLRRQIKDVQLTSHEDAQCIMIDHPDHLYITDDYIITHNTFLTCNVIREAQKDGAFVVVGDSEHALDADFAAKIGVKTDEDSWLHADLDTISQTQKYISSFLKSYESEYGIGDPEAPKVLLVIDSLDMLMTDAEEENFDKGVMKGDQGQRSKQMKAMLRQFVHAIKHQNISMIVTHQVYRNQDVTNGEGIWIVSDAVKYSLSQITLLTKLKLRGETIGEVNGIRMKCEGYKTRFTKPFQTVTIEVPYETGMDPYNGLLEAAVNLGVVEQKGSWYYLAGTETKFQSKNFHQYANDILLKCEAKTDAFLQVNSNNGEVDESDNVPAKRKRQQKHEEKQTTE